MGLTEGCTQALMSINNYCAITFPNTHSAIQAEKILERFSFSFLIMPVPRIISSGCGLAIKTSPDNYNEVLALLVKAGISIEGAYTVDKLAGSFTKLPF